MMRSAFSGIGAERHHVGGNPAHRPHEQIMQRQIDQRRGEAGDQQRHQQEVARIAQHGVAQRRLVHDELDKLAAHRRRTDDPHRIFLLVLSIVLNASTIGAKVSTWRMSKTSLIGGSATSLGCSSRWVLTHLHGHRVRADQSRIFLASGVGHHAVRRRLEHQRGRLGGFQAVVQPADAEIGHQRHIDQHLRDHHEQDREKEELA